MIGDNFVLTIGIFFILDFLIIILVLWIFFQAMKKLVNNSDFPKIVERWPVISKPDGKQFHRQYIALNGIWYKNCANIIIADEGLYISLGFPISLSNQQVTSIPWKYLSYQKKTRAYLSTMYEYQILIDPPITLTVLERIAQSFPDRLIPFDE